MSTSLILQFSSHECAAQIRHAAKASLELRGLHQSSSQGAI